MAGWAEADTDTGHKTMMRPANRKGLRRLRQLFLWRLGLLCPFAMIIDVMWGDDPDGGPLYATDTIWKYVYCLRKAGWDIDTWPGLGYLCKASAV